MEDGLSRTSLQPSYYEISIFLQAYQFELPQVLGGLQGRPGSQLHHEPGRLGHKGEEQGHPDKVEEATAALNLFTLAILSDF